MLCKMEKELPVYISQCDNTSQLSIPSIFSLFGDLASEHAPTLGLGADVLAKRNLFWVAVRTKIKINSRPRMTENILASTWPEAPGRVRCVRYYTLSKDDISLVEGKTEWAIVDIDSGRPHKLSEIYPDGLEHLNDVVCDEPFTKISEDFSSCELLGKYTVRSTDIDIGQHMNNAKYIHAIFGLFSCSELEDMKITDVEINFRTPCFENDELSIHYRKDGNALEIGILRTDGKVASTIRIA